MTVLGFWYIFSLKLNIKFVGTCIVLFPYHNLWIIQYNKVQWTEHSIFKFIIKTNMASTFAFLLWNTKNIVMENTF